MHPFRLVLILALAAISAVSATTSASYEHHRRRQAGAMAGDLHRRSFDVTFGSPKRMAHRRATDVQLEAQAHLVRIAEAFADSNSQWQQAAIKQLSEGKVPQTYDEWYASTHKGEGQPATPEKKPSVKAPTPSTPKAKSTPSPSPSPSTTNEDDEECDDNDDQCEDDEEPTPQSPAKPSDSPKAKSSPPSPSPKPSPKPKPAPEPTPKPSNGGGNNNGGGNSAGGVVGGLLSGLTQIVTGDATYYSAGLGACGETNSDSDYIVAAGQSLFDRYLTDGNPNHNPLCNKKVKLTYNGKSAVARITDRCPGCTPESLDLTPSLFQDLIGDMGLGRVKITWGFVDKLP